MLKEGRKGLRVSRSLKNKMKTKFEIPQGFSDEIRYFRFFPLRSLIILLATAAPGFLVVKLCGYFGFSLQAIIIWIFIEAVIVGSTIIPKPRERWKDGGGVTYDRLLVRKLIRRRSRCLYIKGYNQLQYDEEVAHDLSD